MRARVFASGGTIVAVATPAGTGAIGVIRISGPEAVTIASALVRLTGQAGLEVARPRTLHRAAVIDPKTGEELDVAMVAKMPGPRSYTGEDVVELSCHGNPVLLGEITRLVMDEGARLAHPGEFTQRAYLNGRLDLLQAEAVAEVIGARTERAVRLATRQLQGQMSETVGTIRERLVDLIAGLEVGLDFPDDEIGASRADAVERATDLTAQLGRLLEGARYGRAVQDGLVVMLTGRPNVGKSSVLNALLGVERAIVSSSPGTTRDLVEGYRPVRGVPVRMVDGAGLGVPADDVDAEGMRRARQAVVNCDLVVVVLDRSCLITPGDRGVLELTAGRERILVANKSDLPAAWDASVTCNCVCSAMTGMGIERLRDRLEQWVDQRTGSDGDEGGIVASMRVIEGIEVARTALRHAVEVLERVPIEAVLVDLREALVAIGQTLGIETDEDVLSRIFARFCVGK